MSTVVACCYVGMDSFFLGFCIAFAFVQAGTINTIWSNYTNLFSKILNIHFSKKLLCQKPLLQTPIKSTSMLNNDEKGGL